MNSYWILCLSALLVGWAVRAITLSRRRDDALVARYHAVFDSVFASIDPRPELMVGGAYGFPTFSVTFASKAALDHAAEQGLTTAFSDQIQQICGHIGTPSNPFRSEMAVHFDYPGKFDVLLEKLRELQESSK